MIRIQGKWFDGQSSARTDAMLTVYDNGLWHVVRADYGDTLLKQAEGIPDISPRLASTPRFLIFPAGGSFETSDNDRVDAALAMLQRSHWSIWVHALESRLRYILPALVLLIVVGFAGAKYGIPAAAKLITAHLPKAVFEKAGEQTLDILDRMLFKPSELEPEVVQRVRNHFAAVLDNHPGLGITVLVRKGGRIGPNAFALPGGQVIFTDEMIKVARDDDELLSVLVHEIGHVVHQHGMRRVVQDSILSFAFLAMTGDASGVSELFLGLPVVLTELAYSRGFEKEADQYTLDYLRAHQIDTQHFGNILMRISRLDDEQRKSKGQSWKSYLSTHPPTQERVASFSGPERSP